MNKTEWLDTLQAERAQWNALLAQVDEARMTQPGAVGEWSVKDVIAHVTWFEREMVGVLRTHALVGSELWNLPHDERNAAIYEQNRDRALSEVLAEARAVYDQLLVGMQSLAEEDLHDPQRFAEMPADWIPWQVIAGNCYEHYRQHTPGLCDWMALDAT
jgi:uncharacterized protein (TIGR03083 family)